MKAQEILNKINEERRKIQTFHDVTQKRMWELEDKKKAKTMTRAELYELDACKSDLKRAKKYLEEK